MECYVNGGRCGCDGVDKTGLRDCAVPRMDLWAGRIDREACLGAVWPPQTCVEYRSLGFHTTLGKCTISITVVFVSTPIPQSSVPIPNIMCKRDDQSMALEVFAVLFDEYEHMSEIVQTSFVRLYNLSPHILPHCASV